MPFGVLMEDIMFFRKKIIKNKLLILENRYERIKDKDSPVKYYILGQIELCRDLLRG